MPTEVLMPQMGESIVEGTITKWLKKPGDVVAKDEPLFEISTDKVDAEIPSPEAGVVAESRVAAGETVTVNTVVALLAEPGTVIAQAAPAAAVEAVGTPVVMPQMGESIVEGTIARWLKKLGDKVEKDEPLFEISTDKVDAEIPSPEAGVLIEIRVEAGQTVEINTVVATIGAPGAAIVTGSGTVAVADEAAGGASSFDPAVPYVVPVVDAQGRKLRSSPLVRRIARENRLDLAAIKGTGAGGRITKADVLDHLKRFGPGSARPAAKSTEPELPVGLFDGKRPLSRMRSIIAARMVESKRVSPHVHSVYKIDMTRVAKIRAAEKSRFERQYGVRLTYMPFIAKAAVEALERFPILNASLVGEEVEYHGTVHLGIAVALEWGLIVPVIRNAEKRSFVELAKSVADLAARARSKKLSPDEAQGSTFTLTNSGVFGGEFGTPILNQPESGILAIGGLRKEPVVLTDGEGNDTIGIRQMQSYCLGFDHRLIDGADAGKFLATFQKKLENWDEALD